MRYRVFVEKSHRRFHPDRWSAWGLLAAIKNGAHGMIEVAANMVAHALTPEDNKQHEFVYFMWSVTSAEIENR